MKSLIVIIFLTSLINVTFAGNRDIENYINTEIDTMVTAINQMDETIDERNDRWFLDVFRIHLTGSFGIEVPWIAKLVVKPTVQFHFKRSLPEGYLMYKPVN